MSKLLEDTSDLQVSVEEIFGKLNDLPPFSALSHELLNNLEDENLSLTAIVDKISLDQSLAAKVLKVANSSKYGSNSKAVTIHQAISMLGVENIKSLIRISLFHERLPHIHCRGFDNKAFWRHNIATAICSEVIARKMHLKPHFAFTAGLLHDIGRLVFAFKFPKKYEQVLIFAKNNDCHLIDAERSLLGLDHASSGFILSVYWNFSPAIQDAIRGHHEPDDEELNPIVHIVHVANAIVHALDLSQEINETLPAISRKSWDHLGLNKNTYLSIFHETELRFEAMNQLIE